jgi:hypothetical protein
MTSFNLYFISYNQGEPSFNVAILFSKNGPLRYYFLRQFCHHKNHRWHAASIDSKFAILPCLLHGPNSVLSSQCGSLAWRPNLPPRSPHALSSSRNIYHQFHKVRTLRPVATNAKMALVSSPCIDSPKARTWPVTESLVVCSQTCLRSR